MKSLAFPPTYFSDSTHWASMSHSLAFPLNLFIDVTALPSRSNHYHPLLIILYVPTSELQVQDISDPQTFYRCHHLGFRFAFIVRFQNIYRFYILGFQVTSLVFPSKGHINHFLALRILQIQTASRRRHHSSLSFVFPVPSRF